MSGKGRPPTGSKGWGWGWEGAGNSAAGRQVQPVSRDGLGTEHFCRAPSSAPPSWVPSFVFFFQVKEQFQRHRPLRGTSHRLSWTRSTDCLAVATEG